LRRGGEIGVGNAHLLKAQLASPLADFTGESAEGGGDGGWEHKLTMAAAGGFRIILPELARMSPLRAGEGGEGLVT